VVEGEGCGAGKGYTLDGAKHTPYALGRLEVDFPKRRRDSANGVRLERLRSCGGFDALARVRIEHIHCLDGRMYHIGGEYTTSDTATNDNTHTNDDGHNHPYKYQRCSPE
jgi:hypothetical protein